jgi:hypothetical protein
MTIDNTMIKLIARAYRRQQLLLQGVYASIEELAETEAINPSYVSRVMRLACLAPAITEAILESQHSAHLTAKELLSPFTLDWVGRRAHFKAGLTYQEAVVGLQPQAEVHHLEKRSVVRQPCTPPT